MKIFVNEGSPFLSYLCLAMTITCLYNRQNFMVQVLIGIIVLLACAVLALFILKGLNRKAK